MLTIIPETNFNSSPPFLPLCPLRLCGEFLLWVLRLVALQQVFFYDTALLAGPQNLRLLDDHRRIFVKPISVATRTGSNPLHNDRITSFANLI